MSSSDTLETEEGSRSSLWVDHGIAVGARFKSSVVQERAAQTAKSAISKQQSHRGSCNYFRELRWNVVESLPFTAI